MFKTLTPLPVTLTRPAVVVYRGWLYSLGGFHSGQTTKCYRAPLGADGSLGAWESAGNDLPAGADTPQAFEAGGRIYVVFGFSGADSTSNVWFSDILPDGRLGAWKLTWLKGPNTPAAVTTSHGKVWVVGGITGDRSDAGHTISVNDIFKADINSTTGQLENWKSIGTIPVNDQDIMGCAVGEGWVFTKDNVNKKVWYARLTHNGIGAWQSQDIPLPIYNAGLMIHLGRFYIVGGYDNVTFDEFTAVLSAKMGTDGKLGTFSQHGAGLPVGNDKFGMTLHDGRLYCLGGEDVDVNPVATVFVSQLSSDGNRT